MVLLRAKKKKKETEKEKEKGVVIGLYNNANKYAR